MATVAEVIYDIREALSEFSDDNETSDEYILYLLNIRRVKYIKQKIEQLGRGYNNRVLQTLCLDTELVPTNECGLDLTCDNIVRTVRPIPNVIQLSTTDALQRVAPADKLSQKFNLISRERATNYLHSRFNTKIKAFLHDDGHIYLVSTNPLLIECLSITGIFDDPTELQYYNNCCGCEDETSCFDMNTTEYPIQTELLDLVRKDVIQELLKLKNVPQDKINNSQDDV